MLSSIPTIYVQLSADRLTVRNIRTGETLSEVPEIAISYQPKATILGVGTAARTHAAVPQVKIINPFAHPRSLVSDFTVGEQVLKAFLRRIQGDSVIAASPRVIMHPQGEPEGGYTQVEVRAMHEMAIGAGASRVNVWHGRALTDEELRSGKFPMGGEVLS